MKIFIIAAIAGFLLILCEKPQYSNQNLASNSVNSNQNVSTNETAKNFKERHIKVKSENSFDTKDENIITVKFPVLAVTIFDVKPDEYKVSISENKAVIKSLLYEDIDGKNISIEGEDFEELSARIRFDFGILQYLTDDSPAGAIDFIHKSDWTKISIADNSIQIPQNYDNYKNIINVYQFLGFSDEEEFIKSLEETYFQKIKKISYKKQKEFYENLLIRDRERYEKCCPEYIEQAEKFLSRNPDEFKDFNDLALEVYTSKIILELSGISSSGKKFTYYLMGENAKTNGK